MIEVYRVKNLERKNLFSSHFLAINYQTSEYRGLSASQSEHKSCFSQVYASDSHPSYITNAINEKVLENHVPEKHSQKHNNLMTFNNTPNGSRYPNGNNSTAVPLKPIIKSEYSIKSEKCVTSKSPLFNSNTNENQIPSSAACATSLMSVHQQHSPQINNFSGSMEMPTTIASTAQRNAFDNQLSVDDAYARSYTQMNEIGNAAMTRSIVSYPNEIVSSRASSNYEFQVARSYENAMNGIPPSSATLDRYDLNCLMSNQRPSMYPYLQPTMDDLNNQQKYLHEQHQMTQAMLKSEHDTENSTPLYPRPMYHYDPTTGQIASGFSAMNLSVKMAAAFRASTAAAAAGSIPIIDLSSANVTSTSAHPFNSQHYGGQRLNNSNPSSPRMENSPRTTPQPQNQHNQSVDRLPNNGEHSPAYPNQSDSVSHNNNGPFTGKRSPQTEPVDFSAPLRPLNGGFAFSGSLNHPSYSRESTPDSGTSPYMESFKADPTGKLVVKKSQRNQCQLCISIVFLPSHILGYSPHPNYGMVVQSDYPTNNYASYAAAAYQYGSGVSLGTSIVSGNSNNNGGIDGNGNTNTYASALIGTSTGFPSSVSIGGGISSAACYTMPPPQHLPQHEKICPKDR